MITTIRAGLSVVLLAGFYLLAFGIVGGLAWLAYWLWSDGPSGAAAKVSYLVVVIAGGLGVALWKVVRAKPEQPGGLPLRPDEAPQLWGVVGDLARQVGTRAPDEIRLIPDVNAAVSEDAKAMGLFAGRRYMYIGMPLAQAFTVAQLRSVLAHELGHYSHQHTRLGALAHRGRMTIVQTIQQIGPTTFAGRIFRLYARLYILVESAVSRRQEYEADQASVRVAGREAAVGAMRDLPVVAAAWNFYLDRYVGPGWEAGYAPTEVFAGFSELLAHRKEELDGLRASAPPSERSKWDSHPPIADRIRAMALMPEPAGVEPDDRPATALFPDLAKTALRLEDAAFAVEGRTRLSWHEYTAASLASTTQQDADALFRAAGRLAGVERGDLGTALDLVAAGRAAELARAVSPHDDPDSLVGFFAAAISVAAVKSGTANWRHSWSGPAELVASDGTPMPVGQVAALAAAGDTVGQARERLGGLGVDVAAARQESDRATASGADLVGGLANMKCGKDYFDVYVLTRGLVLVPGPKSTDNGKDRLVKTLQEAGSATALASQYRFVAFEEVASVQLVKKIPVRVDITLHSGETIPLHQGWTGETLAKDSDEVLRQALAPFTAGGAQ
jgi:Zn-dependent protease with chaperone function